MCIRDRSLLLFVGFKKVSTNKNKEQSTNIEQLNILKYAPENNKLLFISNLDSFNIVNNNEKDKNPTNKDNFFLIKDSILDYLGIDLGNNKLEDIYNNELIISTFENNKKLEDDILIVFKIKPEKTIDDLLNLPNKIDQIGEIISINRENKLNFINFILIKDSILEYLGIDLGNNKLEDIYNTVSYTHLTLPTILRV